MLGLKVSVILVASASTAMATVANRAAPSRSGKCRPNQFFFEPKSLCLPKIGGTPPHNFGCPSNWYWGPDDYCIPLSEKGSEQKICAPGQVWNQSKLYCKAEKPTPVGDCKPEDQFSYRSMCLPLGGIMGSIEDPPKNFACPRNKYWYSNQCVPFFPEYIDSKKCPQGYKWNDIKSYCAVAA